MLSAGAYPQFIIGLQMLMRICRTYDLDPRAYSELISSVIMATMMSTMGFGALGMGAILEAVGFRKTFLIFACLTASLPAIILTGFHPKLIGKPFAPPPDDETEGQQEMKRAEREAAAAMAGMAKESKA